MTPKLRQALLIAPIAFCSRAGGRLDRADVHPRAGAPRSELHDFMHKQLDLDASQHARLEALETDFATQKRVAEAELQANNAALASAIAREHGEGPQVAAAVDGSHRAMGALQKLMLAHIFAMRALMRPDQAAQFDAAVTRALTAEGQ